MIRQRDLRLMCRTAQKGKEDGNGIYSEIGV